MIDATLTSDWIAENPGFVHGVLSTLFVGLATYFMKNLPRVVRYVRNNLLQHRNITLLEALLRREQYETFPRRSKNPRFWIRIRDLNKKDYLPTYHFFIRGSGRSKLENLKSLRPELQDLKQLTSLQLVLQGFKGFLLPPLDFGHGGEDDQKLQLDFHADWEDYLTGIGLKAHHAKNGHSDGPWLHFLSSLGLAKDFEGRRIIVFDRDLINLVLNEEMWLFETAQMEDGSPRFLPGFRNDRKVNLCRNIVRYAFHVAKIHSKMHEYEDAINCHYVDKATIVSKSYYDFGCYRIEGIDVLYVPHYLKTHHKPIKEERVFIGRRSRQRIGLKEYIDPFDKLWSKIEPHRHKQFSLIERLRKEQDMSLFSDLGSEYYRATSLALSFFELGYFYHLRRIFSSHCGPELRIGETNIGALH